ncbi:lysophosphatidic acid receptor 2-like [Hemicordylus capensis]|uniref:lysophosphatidic acid receptor 2-like n=1 Tax=Hemicordylus capensis TaxID=884348 RepID=UPI0023042F81|nr:lysophosphatidic acid receptor 2-like [Hemicordylus capensis]
MPFKTRVPLFLHGQRSEFSNHTPIWTRHLVLSLGVPQLTVTSVSILFNSAVILAIACSKDMHKPIFILFCNLAIADLLSSSSSLWIAILFITNPQSTVDGSKALLLAYTSYTMSILATIYNLVSIGFERYLVVTESLKSRYWVTRNQTLIVVLGIWMPAVFLGFMPLMGWNCLDAAKSSVLYSPLCNDYLIFITIPHGTLAIILPFFTYFKIIIFLRKQKTTMGALGQPFGTYRLAELQVARMSIFIWSLALLSYAPFFVGVILDSTSQQSPENLPAGIYVFRNLTAMMITMNSLGNPIVYTLKVKKLGHRLRLLKCPSNNRIEVYAIGKI